MQMYAFIIEDQLTTQNNNKDCLIRKAVRNSSLFEKYVQISLLQTQVLCLWYPIEIGYRMVCPEESWLLLPKEATFINCVLG